MPGGGNQPEKAVLISAHKKMERLRFARHRAILKRAGARLIKLDRQTPAGNPQRGGFVKKTVPVLVFITVWRNESGEQGNPVQDDENYSTYHCDPLPAETPPDNASGRFVGRIRPEHGFRIKTW